MRAQGKICIKCHKHFLPKRSDTEQCPKCKRKQQDESSKKCNEDRTFKKFANQIKNPDVYTDGVFNPKKAEKAILLKDTLEDAENEFRNDYFNR